MLTWREGEGGGLSIIPDERGQPEVAHAQDEPQLVELERVLREELALRLAPRRLRQPTARQSRRTRRTSWLLRRRRGTIPRRGREGTDSLRIFPCRLPSRRLLITLAARLLQRFLRFQLILKLQDLLIPEPVVDPPRNEKDEKSSQK